jgi:acyl CoA:acetate/3-ketoacid CoA transferase alpha subunit
VAHAEQRATKRQKKMDGREAVLELPVRADNVVITTLRARRAAMLGNAANANINN